MHRERAEQDAKIKTLEALLLSGGGVGSAAELQAMVTAASGGSAADSDGAGESGSMASNPSSAGTAAMFLNIQHLRDENNQLNDRIHFLEQEVSRLQTYADEYAELEESRTAFDDYQRHSTQVPGPPAASPTVS